MKPIFLSLERDSFPQSEINGYKKSLISVPEIFTGRKGNLISQANWLIKDRGIQNSIFREIKINGKNLPETHWLMLCQVIPDCKKIDFSDFFKEILLASTKNKPKYFFKKIDRKEKKVETVAEKISPENDPRPPADWCYFFSLLLFLDGKRALASTVDEDPKVISWFQKNNQEIKDICGFTPLILDTPLWVETRGFVSKLNEMPRKALSGNGFLKSIPPPPPEKNDFFEIMKYYEESILHNS